MKKTRKCLCVFCAVCMIFVMSVSASATTLGNPTYHMDPNCQLVETLEAEENKAATIEFVDEELLNANSNSASPRGTEYEEYISSTYSYVSRNRDRNPISNDPYNEKTIGTVGKGMTEYSKETVTTSATLSFDVSVSADIKLIVHAGLGFSASGTVSKTVEKGYTLVGPPENSQYNSREYILGVLDFNTVVTIKRTDKYAIHSGVGIVGYKYVDVLETYTVTEPVIQIMSFDHTYG